MKNFIVNHKKPIAIIIGINLLTTILFCIGIYALSFINYNPFYMFSGPFYRQTLYIIFLFPLPFSILSTITFFISDKISKLISRKKNNINLTIEDEDEDEDIITDYYNTQKTTRNILIITIATILAVITAIPTLQQLIPYYKEDYIIPPKNPTSLFEQINQYVNEKNTEKVIELTEQYLNSIDTTQNPTKETEQIIKKPQCYNFYII